MSLQSFQSALAYVIRSYDVGTDLEIIAQNYELTNDEKCILYNVMHQQMLTAYSEDLFFSRFIIIKEALAFLEPYVDFKAMRTLWAEDFEKKSVNVFYEELVLRFIEYLAYDPVGMQFIAANTRDFLPSLIRYVHCVFTFKHNILPSLLLPPNTSLTGLYFKVLDVDYDVRSFFAELIEIEDFSHIDLDVPKKRKLTILFVATKQVTEFRSFEIDDELKNYLTTELSGDCRSNILPRCYKELVELGLCKPTSKTPCCNHEHAV